MSNQSARSFRTESALRRARIARSITCGSITIGRLPSASPEPRVASVLGPVAIALPRYPGVLARTAEGGLVFMRPVHVVHRRGPSLLGR